MRPIAPCWTLAVNAELSLVWRGVAWYGVMWYTEAKQHPLRPSPNSKLELGQRCESDLRFVFDASISIY